MQDLSLYKWWDVNSRFDRGKSTIVVDGLQRDEDAWAYERMSFAGDFSIEFDVSLDVDVNGGGLAVVCGVQDVVNDVSSIYTGDPGNTLFIMLWDGSGGDNDLRISEMRDGAWTQDRTPSTVVVGTKYYCIFQRIGTNGYCYIYTDASHNTLYDTVTIALNEVYEFEFFFAVNTYNSGLSAQIDFTVSHFEIAGAEPDYLQDLTQAIELDPNSTIALDRFEVVATAINNNETAYLGYDFGDEYFTEIDHKFSYLPLSDTNNGAIVLAWMLSDTLQGSKELYDAGGAFFNLYYYDSNERTILWENPPGGGGSTDTFTHTAGTRYWIRVWRELAGSANGDLYAYIYTDAAMQTLADTLVVTLSTAIYHFRYYYPVNSWNTGGNLPCTFEVADVDLGDVKIEPYEDFRTYNFNLEEPRLFHTATRMIASGVNRETTIWTNKDFGAGYFDGDFAHKFAFYFGSESSAAANGAVLFVWMLTLVDEEPWETFDNDGSYLCAHTFLSTGGAKSIYCRELFEGTFYSDSYTISYDTKYFATIVRDEAVGTYGTQYMYIYSDFDRTVLLDTMSVTLHEKFDLRYYSALSGYDSGAVGDISYGYTECHDLGLSVAPYEDFFNDYIEEDPSDTISTEQRTRLTMEDFARDEDAWTVKDHGVDHFTGRWEHTLACCCKHTSTGTWGWASIYALTNVESDLKTIDDASGDFLEVHFLLDGAGSFPERIEITECDGGALTVDSWNSMVANEIYYLKIGMDPDAGTYGTLYCQIFADEEMRTQVDLLAIPINSSVKSYQYLMAPQIYNDGGTEAIDYWVEKVDLQETVDPDGWLNQFQKYMAGGASWGWANYTIRTIIPAEWLETAGTQVRVTVSGGGHEGLYADNISIVERDGETANGTTTPTEILFDTRSGVKIHEAYQQERSDATNFNINPARDYLLITDVGGTAGKAGTAYSINLGGLGYYYKTAANSYDQQNLAGASSVTADDPCNIIMKLEIIEGETGEVLQTIFNNSVNEPFNQPFN